MRLFEFGRPIICRDVNPPGGAAIERSRSNMNILIVEDHQDTRRVLSTLLGRADHEVITATGVSDALKLLKNVRVNVLLSDLGLPDGDGIDLVKKAKNIQPKLTAIALTARESTKDHELGQKAGFDHYL